MAALVAVPLGATPASARSFEVTRTDDPNPGQCRPRDCSLREAVLAANARSGADIIELDTGPIHTLQRPPAAPDDPEGGDLDVSGPLTVVGRGSGRARIRGQEEDRLFHVEGAGRLTLMKLNLFNGETSNSGGAIRVETFGGDAKLRVDRSSFYDNVAGSDGGAIAADGDLPVRITRSDFAFNAAESDGGAILLDDGGSLKRVTLRSNTAGRGGGLLSFDGAKLTDLRVERNRALGDEGGGLYLYQYDFPIEGSVISGNRAADGGGGIHSAGAVVTLLRSTVEGNRSGTDIAGPGGGFAADGGSLQLSTSSVLDNRANGFGGGLHLAGGALGTIVRSTIAGNRAVGGNGGGGVAVRDAGTTASFTNSTIAENRAMGFGGGIETLLDATTELDSATVTHNEANSDAAGTETGGGLGNGAAGGISIRNSLIAANSAAGEDSGVDCQGPVTATGVNLVQHVIGCPGVTDPPDITGVGPEVRRLSDNGGPTHTVALRVSSPARNAAEVSGLERDQRGVRRQNPDVGAFEYRR